MPDCLVLIPYHEAGEKLLASLDSIVDPGQRLEVLVVDDGSRRLPATASVDGRSWPFPVRIETLPRNVGIAEALNHGLGYAAPYTYVARLDCGDTCLPNRFRLQLDELDQHPDLLLLGGAAEFATPEGRTHLEYFPTTWAGVLRRLRVNSAFLHPSVVFRSAVIDRVGLYPVDRPAAEDYAWFWSIAKVGEARSLRDVVLRYEIDPDAISSLHRRRQIRSRIQVMRDNFDLTPGAVWGLVRSAVLYLSPRRAVVQVRRALAPLLRNDR
ncbi:glycosyltransferase [Nocardioides sp. WS12]|uniref:glycosyltransferase n=1 Tax=Nocardioides sp. WS12 TaxID=2486272 RepID=UPI0015FD23BF|nr:glycosyltransferase [Nocardioides sp. WS12]